MEMLFQTPSTSGDPLLTLAQYGLLGLILVMLLTGWLWAKPAVDDMKKQHEFERKLWEERLIPTLEKLTSAIERNNSAIDANSTSIRTNTNELSEAIRHMEDRR